MRGSGEGGEIPAINSNSIADTRNVRLPPDLPLICELHSVGSSSLACQIDGGPLCQWLAPACGCIVFVLW